MKYLKNAFELYINSSIHVSLAVVAFTLVSIFEHDLEVDKNLILFIFFASITGYNFVKYAGIAKLYHLSLATNLRLIQIFSLLCFVAMIFFASKLDINVLIATGIMGVFTLFYALPVFGGEKNLRSLPGIKIIIIAVVWAGSTVIIPLINSEKVLGIDLIVDFLQRLMLVVVLTLPFEIRDLEYDNVHLGTIPQKLGVFMTKVFGSVLLFIILCADLFQRSFNSTEFLSLLMMLVISGFFLWGSGMKQGRFYSSFWVEALPIMYLGLYLLFRFFLPQIPF
ncbi:membrane protein [Christiangramia echinicola]|uniref:membrane protein n=1 Tax=Christiangramia echinicola TaxID=279359 RepID=UPI000478CFC2|nr:membrane protein [Christiangramia echinicola]